MILFRGDGNPGIGSGHIMRCLSLAEAFRKRGVESVFVMAGPCLQETIQKKGFPCVVLHSRYDDMRGELDRFLPLLGELSPDGVILDSYFVTPAYMEALKKAAALVYIDDQNAFDYPADIVVNYNLRAESVAYPAGKQYLLGMKYAPLRPEFYDVEPRTPAPEVREVLFSTGGGDPGHVALACVRYLRDHDSLRVYHLILGALNPDTEEIERLAGDVPHIVLHRNVSDMCTLMLRCDAAVSAAGTTLCELCACGLPTVTYVLADNQLEGAKAFAEEGLTLNAGDVRIGGAVPERLFACLEELAGDWPLRREMARRMRSYVDGKGALHLADRLLICLAETKRNRQAI